VPVTGLTGSFFTPRFLTLTGYSFRTRQRRELLTEENRATPKLAENPRESAFPEPEELNIRNPLPSQDDRALAGSLAAIPRGHAAQLRIVMGFRDRQHPSQIQ
jgi:hypothetical protein